MMAAGVDELFTASSLLSLQGAAAAAVLVPNVLVSLLGDRFSMSNRRWLAFGIAELIAFWTAAIASGSSFKWVIAFLNGCLVFASALGVNQALFGVGSAGGEVVVMKGSEGVRATNRSWLGDKYPLWYRRSKQL
jgi:hypothetical protein